MASRTADLKQAGGCGPAGFLRQRAFDATIPDSCGTGPFRLTPSTAA